MGVSQDLDSEIFQKNVLLINETKQLKEQMEELSYKYETKMTELAEQEHRIKSLKESL